MPRPKSRGPAHDPTGPAPQTGLSLLLATINALLARAVDRHAEWLGPASLLDPWRGLHLTVEDVRQAVRAVPGAALIDDGSTYGVIAARARDNPRFARASQIAALSDLDVAVVALALAPEVDLRYERIYAYLQDDVARKRPTLDLLARLLCVDADARLALFARFAREAPLVERGLVEWQGSPDAPDIARPIAVDALWRNYFLERDEFDARLGGCVRLERPGAAGLDHVIAAESTRARLRECAAAKPRFSLILEGPHGAGKAHVSRALAHELGQRLLVLDLRDAASAAEVTGLLRRADCASVLHGALLCVHGVGRFAPRDPQSLRALVHALAGATASYVLWLSDPMPQLHAEPLDATRIALALPPAPARADAWRNALALRAIAAPPQALERVAERFTLSVVQIAQAAADLSSSIPEREPRVVSERELATAARALCGSELARLAQRITPEASFDALVTTAEVTAQLCEIRDRVAGRERVRRTLTRGSVHARSAGVTALFAGPSGTGKTLAAEVVACELGYDLFRIDLAAVVSKYIGETEKNLDRVFTAAENANAVLLFDEADALFGKRSEVKDAHDRYANIEIAYLLQKMEQFDGLAILATNLKQNLDEAFARRLTFTVNFAFPEAGERQRLWETLWPPHAPRASDVDFSWFAHEYPLSGGNIRNAVLAAVHLAAANGQVASRDHLLHATRREYQKLGKNMVLPVRAAERRAS